MVLLQGNAATANWYSSNEGLASELSWMAAEDFGQVLTCDNVGLADSGAYSYVLGVYFHEEMPQAATLFLQRM